tara:strand:+ start:1558 stop:2823 length:1266 start_codon:yes stop_codon:yes gene_type:complete
MPIFTSPFTGTVVQPTDVSYYALSFSANVQLYWPAVVNPTQVPAARIIDATPSVASLIIKLPEANQGTTGADILIRNFGAVAFTVQDFAGTGSVSIPAGVSKYFYLSNNSTSAGVWQNVTFGAGTSSADAASLAGPGLVALSGQLNTTQNIVEVSSPPTITNLSRASTFVWTAGNNTINLPTAVSLTAGWFIAFRNTGTGTLTFAPQGTSLINGGATLGINPAESGFILFQQSTGNFFTVGLAVPSNVTFTSSTYDVDSIAGGTFSLVSYAPIIQTYAALSGTRSTTLAVTLPATTQLYVLVNETGQAGYNITFQVSGSLQTPISLADGAVALVLSDGNFLYVISQSTTNVFYAINGSAAAPSHSFTSNTNTGMYLVGTNVLGLSANSTNMLRLDNTNTLSPQVSTPATFTAGLISGGTFV